MIIGFSRAGVAAPSGIQLVGVKFQGGGGNATSTISLTALTGGIGTTALDGDLVIAFGGKSHSINYDVAMVTSGYTEDADIYANDGQDCNLGVFHKFMTATPDTTAVLDHGGTSTNSGIGGVIVLRGVDPTTPLDVAVVTATGTDGNLSDPAAITPVTAGAWIIGIYAGSNNSTATNPTGPANMTNFAFDNGQGSTTGLQLGVATKTDWTSGAFDPDAWTGTDNEATTSWCAVTLAIRPA